MALFTDGGPASIADMKRYDSAAEDLAHEASIDLDAKLSVAAEEMGQDIFQFLLFHTTSRGNAASFLMGLPPGEAARQRTGLSDVVVTAALRRWHALKALESLYRDAYGSDVTDRFRLKWEQYQELARDAADYAFTTGIGLARNPVPRAAAPVVTAVSQAADRTDSAIRIAWVGESGTEGAPSDPWQAALGPGDQVWIQDPASADVSGWNIYAGPADGTPTLQNDTPIAVGAAWTCPLGALRQGKALVEAQIPDYLVMERRILPRG